MSFPFRAPSRTVMLPLAVTLAMQAMVSMAVVAIPVLAPVIAVERGIPAAYAGGFVAMVYAGSMLSTLVGGTFVLRYGAIRVSQACLVFAAAGLLMAASGSLAALIAASFLIGFGYGPLTPASSHVLAQTTPPQYMSFTFSVKQTGVPVGAALAGAILPSVELFAGWRGALNISAAFCLLVAWLAQGLRESLDHDRYHSTRIGLASVTAPVKLVLREISLRRLAIVSFSYAAVQLCLMTYIVTYLTHELGLSLISAGLMLSVANVAGIAGRIAWGVFADRFASARGMLSLLGFGMGACCLLTAILQAGTPGPLLFVVLALFGATAIGWNGVYLAEVARLARAGSAGLATGATLFFTYAGVLIGPPAFGVFAEFSSYAKAFAGLALVGFSCGIWLAPRWKPPRQSE